MAKTISETIAERGLKLVAVANRLGISRDTLRLKLRGEYEWKLSELLGIKAMLGMGDEFWSLIEGGGKEETK